MQCAAEASKDFEEPIYVQGGPAYAGRHYWAIGLHTCCFAALRSERGALTTLFMCRVDLHTQDGTTGRNSAEAEALIHAAQTIFGLGGALLQLPCLT